MQRHSFYIVLWSCLSVILMTMASCDKPDEEVLTIAVAANVQYAIDPIMTSFTTSTGIKCEKVVGSSGKLTALISEGAPYDLFLSADMRYPEQLYQAGNALSAPTTYAYGQLVLWSINELAELTLPSLLQLDRIAIANPKVAPYGAAALESLVSEGHLALVDDKLVYGESVGQAAQFAATGAADVAFLPRSLAMSATLRNKGYWADVAQALHKPIDQGVIVISRDGKHKEGATTFVKYLLTPKIQKQLQNAGYIGVDDRHILN